MLDATSFVGSAGASDCGKELRQTVARLSRSFEFPEGNRNGGIERTNPVWPSVGYKRKALFLFWLSHFGRGSGRLTTWRGTRNAYHVHSLVSGQWSVVS
jgi:hypothetical protein